MPHWAAGQTNKCTARTPDGADSARVARGLFVAGAEGAFYGRRKPPVQKGAKLLHVSDLLLLGRTTIEESRALLYWMQTQVRTPPRRPSCRRSVTGAGHTGMVKNISREVTEPLVRSRMEFCVHSLLGGRLGSTARHAGAPGRELRVWPATRSSGFRFKRKYERTYSYWKFRKCAPNVSAPD